MSLWQSTRYNLRRRCREVVTLKGKQHAENSWSCTTTLPQELKKHSGYSELTLTTQRPDLSQHVCSHRVLNELLPSASCWPASPLCCLFPQRVFFFFFLVILVGVLTDHVIKRGVNNLEDSAYLLLFPSFYSAPVNATKFIKSL